AKGVELLQVGTAFLHVRRDSKEIFGGRNAATNVVARGRGHDLVDVQVAVRVAGAAANDERGGRDDAPAAEARLARPGDQQRLVDVEMQDLPERAAVLPSQRDCGRLAHAVGDRVGMTDPLVLADLRGARGEGRGRVLDDDVFDSG